jgi:serine/threonine protein kinase/Tfp pilus assembly protein PilF
MIGKTISHYKIIEKLGGGGMGVVYKAEDTKLGRTVALKFLPPAFSLDEEAKQRFIHEAKAASSLEHNNICTIYEIDETVEGQLFIAMAFYEGETLQKKIERRPIKIDETTDITIQIAEGLYKAHEKNIIHRDIKPANIFITYDGVIKIIDFGLAKVTGQTQLTKIGSTTGTVAYMSPEQARGETVDNRTDIWSLGVVLYEMISGQQPFKGDYDQAVVYSIVNEEPEQITSLRTGVPMELERIVNRALAKDPQDRYQHADDLLSELNRFKKDLDSDKIPIKTTSEKRKKNVVFFPAIILSIIALVIVGYLLLKPSLPEKGELPASEWENSIAVLPFKNISPDPEQEYFCDGMTEQIITNLSRLPRLKVIAQTSVMKFKDSKKTIPEIGKELNVSHVLEGSVRKAGNRIRVTAQLINAESGYHQWANDYERGLDDIFAVQDDVSLAIAKALSENLSLKEIGKIKTNRPANTEAYEYFLKASYFHDKYWKFIQLQDFKTSEAMYKKAIELDPNYATAYAYLSGLYYSYIYYNPEEKERFIYLKEKYMEIALNLNSNSLEVQFIHIDQITEPEKRYDGLKKILYIDPNHFGANHQMGIQLRSIGLSYHSFLYFDKAVEVNPLDQWSYAARGLAYEIVGELDKAKQDYKFSLQIAPDDYWTMRFYTSLLIMLKKSDEAEKLLNRFETKYPDDAYVKYYKSLLMAVKGDSLNALRFFEESKFGKWGRTILYSILNLKDNALELMQEHQDETGKDVLSSEYLIYKHRLWYDNLRDDNRFKKILEEEKRRYEITLKKYGVIIE